jgi:hypothetical protein
MAVNEGLYNWMLKTYGMPAAEWYRSNPGSKPGANPFLPKGAYVPLADVGSDDTYASVSPEFEEVSVVEPASSAPDYFQQLLNSLNPEEQKEIQDIGLTDEEKKDAGYRYAASQQLGINDSPFTGYETDRFGNYIVPTNDPLVRYDPTFGKYGGYSTREDLSFSPRSVLYQRYEDAIKDLPIPQDIRTTGAVALRSNPGLAPGYSGDSPETLELLANYDRIMAAREKAFEDSYKTPLSQIQYQSYSDAPSLDAFREQFKSLGIDIPLLSGDWTYHVRSATEEDPEVQQFGIYNVGRSDYRTTRQREAIDKNIEILKQQAEQGIEGSQQFLNDYIAEGGEGTEPQYGPRGEILGDVAVQYGDGFPKTPGWMKELDRLYKETKDKPFKPGTPKPGRGLGDVWEGPLPGASAPAPVDVRVARASQQSDKQRERLTQQSEFDMSKERQFASAKAAEAYRRGAAAEDPFRAAARMG